MVFDISEYGLLTADTLCNFVEFPREATHLVSDKCQVRILVDFVCSGAPAARMVAKRSTISTGTEPHPCIEIDRNPCCYYLT